MKRATATFLMTVAPVSLLAMQVNVARLAGRQPFCKSGTWMIHFIHKSEAFSPRPIWTTARPGRDCDAKLVAACDRSAAGIAPPNPSFNSSRRAHQSHCVQLQGSYNHTKGKASRVIRARLGDRGEVHSGA
jgi:hypothetical protein